MAVGVDGGNLMTVQIVAVVVMVDCGDVVGGRDISFGVDGGKLITVEVSSE